MVKSVFKKKVVCIAWDAMAGEEGSSKGKVPTGIEGFDKLCEGGLVRNSINIISGPAGSAKTLFCSTFIYTGAKMGEKGLYLTLEESADSVINSMKGYDMDPERYMASGDLFLIDLGGMAREGISGKEDLERKLVGFQTIITFIEIILATTDIKRLVIDSLVAAGLYYGEENELRREMFRFARYLKSKKVTAVLITETPRYHQSRRTRYNIEQFIGDSFIHMDLEKKGGEFRRSVTILKMRLCKHDAGTHPFLITPKGMEVQYDVVL